MVHSPKSWDELTLLKNLVIADSFYLFSTSVQCRRGTHAWRTSRREYLHGIANWPMPAQGWPAKVEVLDCKLARHPPPALAQGAAPSWRAVPSILFSFFLQRELANFKSTLAFASEPTMTQSTKLENPIGKYRFSIQFGIRNRLTYAQPIGQLCKLYANFI